MVSDDGHLSVWDAASAKVALETFTSQMLLGLSFAPNGMILATSARKPPIILFNARTGAVVRTIDWPTMLDAVSFSPDGQYVAAPTFASRPQTIELWDAETGAHFRSFTTGDHRFPTSNVSFSPDSTSLAFGTFYGTIHVFDVTTGEHQKRLSLAIHQDAPRDRIAGVAFSPDGTQIASAGPSNSVHLWDAASGEHRLELSCAEERERPSLPQFSPNFVVFNPGGDLVAAGGSAISVWEIPSGRRVFQMGTTRGQNFGAYAAFSPDGRRLAISGSSVRFWNTTSWMEIEKPVGHTAPVRSLAFSGDGKWLASGSDDETAILWDVATGRQRHRLRGLHDAVTSLGFLDDEVLVTATEDQTVRLWTVSSAAQVEVMKAAWQGDAVAGLSNSDRIVVVSRIFEGVEERLKEFAPIWHRIKVIARTSGGTLALDDRGAVHRWNSLEDHELARFPGPLGAVCGNSKFYSALAVMRMGEMAAHSSSGLGAGHKNVLAEREGGAIRYQYFNEPAAVMLFSPNDRLLAIAGQDSWLAVIDVTTGSELFRNDRLRARIRALTFSPDGARLATGHEDSTITLWEIPQTK